MMQKILHKPTHPPFAALQAFEAAARLLSFKAAADELFVTPSAVSHRIRGLEDLLNIQLFSRAPGAVGLTPAGRKYFVQVQDIFGRIEIATRALRTDGMGEELSVHATPSFASLWLMPKISEFMSTRPDVRIKIDASPTPANFAADKVDLDIQYGQIYSRELHAEPLVRDHLTAFCSPEYFDRIGRPTSPSQLAGASFIRNVFNRTQWSDWLAANGVHDLSIDFSLQTPRSMLAIQAALDGIGVALESQVMCSYHLRAGRLVKMFPNSVDIESTDYFLVCPKNNIELPIVRAFINWLVGEVTISNTTSCQTTCKSD